MASEINTIKCTYLVQDKDIYVEEPENVAMSLTTKVPPRSQRLKIFNDILY